MRRKDDDKAQRIKDAVIEVVLEEGFSDASISKIAKRAGVSPATVYTYHENKESMLQSIYIECAEEIYESVLLAVNRNQSGEQIIENSIWNYYQYMIKHDKIFSFVEQFASSPALTHNCDTISGFTRMMDFWQSCIDQKKLQPFSAVNIMAMVFYPVKMLVSGAITYQINADDKVKELIYMTQNALLKSK